MKILDKIQITQKVKRLAIQIVENNFNETELILAGINNNGLILAQMLLEEIQQFGTFDITLTRILLSPAAPLSEEPRIEMPVKELKNKVVIIVDDVANTGRTLFYAMKPILEILPKKLEIAVIVDRKHKSFPIQPNYVGISLATTIQDNILVVLKEPKEMYAELVQ